MRVLPRPVTVPALLLALLIASIAPAAARAETYGTSAEGARLRVEHHGDPGAAVRLLVVGSIHGNEIGGLAVARALERETPRGIEIGRASCRERV